MTPHDSSELDPVMPPAPAETRLHLLQHVRQGMYVLDVAGAAIGRVKEVHFGDPEAASGVGDAPPQPMTSFLGNVADALSHPVLHGRDDEMLARLRHEGYLRIDRKGIMHRDLLVESDQIADVDEEAVTLNVGVEALSEI